MEAPALTIPADWTPTAENVNALPEPLRDYIHQIETLCDPQLLVQQNWELRELVAALEVMLQAERARGGDAHARQA